MYDAIVKKNAKHIDQAIFDVFKEINANIIADSKLDRVGCTVSGILIHDKKLYAINCGDSRVVLARNLPNVPEEQVSDRLIVEDLTTDHVPSNPKELERIMKCFKPGMLDELRRARKTTKQAEIQSPAMARARSSSHGENYVTKFDIDLHLPMTKGDLSIMVTRSLGDAHFRSLDGHSPLLVETPEVKEHDITEDDNFALIMTDGGYKQKKWTAPIYKSYRTKSLNYPLAKLCAGLFVEKKTPVYIAQECISDRLTDDNTTVIFLDLKKWCEKIAVKPN